MGCAEAYAIFQDNAPHCSFYGSPFGIRVHVPAVLHKSQLDTEAEDSKFRSLGGQDIVRNVSWKIQSGDLESLTVFRTNILGDRWVYRVTSASVCYMGFAPEFDHYVTLEHKRPDVFK